MSKLIGDALQRADGPLKVTGGAKYTAEVPLPNVAYGSIVTATVGKGRILSIDTAHAKAAPGVLAVLTPANAPRVHTPSGPMSRILPVLQDDQVHYDRQPVALVVADSFERATEAASLVRVRYEVSSPETEIDRGTPYMPKAVNGKSPDSIRGDADGALASAPVKIDVTYRTPIEHHNPMEPHASTAAWDGDHLTVYDSSQGVVGARRTLAGAFGLPEANVRVINYFVGGGFGCKGTAWSHVVLAAMAAKVVRRPVKVVLTRPQMFSSVGHRPQTIQRVALGAGRDGKIAAQIHEIVSHTSAFDEFVEPSGRFSVMLYDVPNSRITQRLVRLNTATPTFTRAPGETSGSFAFESAMDELADALRIDPIELRLRNYAETDPEQHLPYSSKSLRECYRQGAQRFGWDRRSPQPRSMQNGGMLVGMGMATAVYPTNRSEAAAIVTIRADDTAEGESAGVDIGTGAYTVFAQVVADALGMPPDRVQFRLGDTNMPTAPNAGGSMLTASVGSAAQLAALDARSKVIALAIGDGASPLSGRREDEIESSGGRLQLRADPQKGETYGAILHRQGLNEIAGHADAKPGDEKKKYAMHAFGAQFAEVQVDPDFGVVRVTRALGAFASGRILNAKTARSQYMGGIVMGIGNAIMEITRTDYRSGRIMNANLADYLVPVNADVPPIEIVLVPEDDPHVNPIGVKGIGEIGIVGVTAAIANAVYNATGVRVRDLPISPEKLIV